MEALSETEYDIINALYFVEPFEKIKEEVHEKEPVIIDSLRNLIDKNLIVPMVFDEQSNDFVRAHIYDTDNLQRFHFLATKDGLLAHQHLL